MCLFSGAVEDAEEVLLLLLGGSIVGMAAACDGGLPSVGIVEGRGVVVAVLVAILLLAEVRDIVGHTELQHTPVGQNGHTGHTGGEVYIKGRLLVFPDAFQEHLGYPVVTAAVAGFLDELSVLAFPFGLVDAILYLSLGNLPGIVAEHDLTVGAADIFHHALLTAETVGVAAGAEAGVSGEFEYGVVVIQGGNDGGLLTRIGSTVAVRRLGMVHGHSGYAHGIGAGGVHKRCQGVGQVVSTGEIAAPVLVAVKEHTDVVPCIGGGAVQITGVVVFALGVYDLTQGAALVDLLHFLVEEHVGIVFRQHEDGLALFRCFYQLDTLGHGGIGNALGYAVDVFLQAADDVFRVLVEIVGDEDGIQIVLDEGIEICIAGDHVAQFLFSQFQTLGALVTNGYNLCAVYEKIIHIMGSAAVTEDTDSDLLHV